MNIREAIKSRTSVRSYRPLSLDSSLSRDIETFISALNVPFSAQARIALVHASIGQQKVRLGTYGVVSGASDFLVSIFRPGPMAEQAAAYCMEQVVLHCTTLGLGTCWMGATFRHENFAAAAGLQPGEELRIVSPVGYIAPRRTLLDATMGALIKHTARKQFGTLFFDRNWGVSLTEQAAGEYAQSLEMVRLAPSARNLQPWRIVMDSSGLHFYCRHDASRFTHTDMGIAMCHFSLTCLEMGLGGHFAVMADSPADAPAGFSYIVSWVW